ncbi:Bromodomain-containing protein, partial [Dimargaris cristalligena]
PMSKEQTKYCQAIVRSMKRHRDAGPFLEPVDPVKLNIPDYTSIVKNPMDISTVEKKLTSGQYADVSRFISDVELIFANCVLYNGSESVIAKMAQSLERLFNNQVKKIPNWPPAGGRGVASKKPPAKSKDPSTTTHLPISRTPSDHRIKRDNPPPGRDPSTPIDAALQRRRSRPGSDPQLKFCHQVIRELFKKSHASFAYAFYEPVDYVTLNIPDYPHIVKQPMDLTTLKKRLESGQYDNADEFEADARLIFHNCYLFNPPDNPVHQMGRMLEDVFNKKWSELPPPMTPGSAALSPPPQPREPVEQNDDIAEFERHLEKMARQLEVMKQAKRKQKGGEVSTPPSVHRQRPTDAPRKRSQSSVGGYGSGSDDAPNLGLAPAGGVREITYEQKQELSDGISKLSPDHMVEVVSIIRSSMPEINDTAQDEIELDIDSLDRNTLWRLYSFVR